MRASQNIPRYIWAIQQMGLPDTQRRDLTQEVVDQVEFNKSTKRNKSKIAGKLRRWMTRSQGSRRRRSVLLNTFPCIIVKGRVVA